MTRRISARSGLLLQRLFRLVEQPDVLDGDHRLVGERLEKCDLLGRERIGLRSRPMTMRPSGVPSRSSVARTMRRLRAGPALLDTASGNSASAARMSATWIAAPVGAPLVRPIVPRMERVRCLPIATSSWQQIHVVPPGGVLPFQTEDDEVVAPHTRAAFSATPP